MDGKFCRDSLFFDINVPIVTGLADSEWITRLGAVGIIIESDPAFIKIAIGCFNPIVYPTVTLVTTGHILFKGGIYVSVAWEFKTQPGAH
jgi:hypothetical protein